MTCEELLRNIREETITVVDHLVRITWAGVDLVFRHIILAEDLVLTLRKCEYYIHHPLLVRKVVLLLAHTQNPSALVHISVEFLEQHFLAGNLGNFLELHRTVLHAEQFAFSDHQQGLHGAVFRLEIGHVVVVPDHQLPQFLDGRYSNVCCLYQLRIQIHIFSFNLIIANHFKNLE